MCNVSLCLDNHQFKNEDLETGNVCAQIVVTCLYLARIGRPDVLWTVNHLARHVTKWNEAYDKTLARLISYIQSHCQSQTAVPRRQQSGDKKRLVSRHQSRWRSEGLRSRVRRNVSAHSELSRSSCATNEQQCRTEEEVISLDASLTSEGLFAFCKMGHGD